MKPTFALDLSRDLIALLHRTPKGWLSIGEVAFDAPDLDAKMAYLRSTALGLSPLGVATKIILPASQILYAEIYAPGPSRDEKRRQIAAALEGRTPYAVEDLVFDWSGKGATVKVAVVARETLDEAESFAVAHRMNPVSTVAIPEEGAFVGEPWFGPTAAATATLAEGESVDRDREPVQRLLRDPEAGAAPNLAPNLDPSPAEDARPLADVAEGPETAVPAGELPAMADLLDESLPGLEAALHGELPVALAPSPAADDVPAMADSAAANPSFAEVFSAAEPDQTDPDREADALERSLSAALADVADPVRPAPQPAPQIVPPAASEVEEAPFAHVTDTTAFPDSDEGLAEANETASAASSAKKTQSGPELGGSRRNDAVFDDIPPAKPSAVMMAFASRRAAAGTAPSLSADAASRSTGMAGSIPRPVAPAPGARSVPAAASGKGYSGLVTAPSIPGTRAKPKVKAPVADAARPVAQGTSSVQSPARPGGTFGTSAPPRSRMGVVFAVLVALLLVCLALLAAWASMFLERSAMERNATDPAIQTDLAIDSPRPVDVLPGVEDEMLADLQDPEGLTDPIPEAEGPPLVAGDAGALATETVDLTALAATATPADLAADPVLESVTDTAATPDLATPDLATSGLEGSAAAVPIEPAPAVVVPAEPAPGTSVATELAVAAPPVEDQDEIFLSAMDAPPPALDALALPVPLAVADAVPPVPMPPPAFGTVYQFDARGLLVPTPDGILSPEGVMLIAGPPPLVPPARSEVAAAAAAARALESASPEAGAEAVSAAVPEAGATAADASLVTNGQAAPAGPAAADPTLEPIPSDPAMAGFRPRPRPDGLAPAPTPEDDASLTVPEATSFATLRPLARPATVLAAATAARPAEVAALAPADLGAQGASLAAQAEARLAAAAALEAENPSIVAISMRPAARPRDLSSAVEAAVAAAVRAPEPEAEVIEVAAAPPADLKPEELDELNEPEVAAAAPSIPSKASVAKQATFANAINLSRINLIGTYGTDSRRYALVRQSNGRYKKVKVGDKIDGGTIKAITETEVRYQKGGKLISLAMPKA